MPAKITQNEFRALAELRHQIRQFLREGDAASLKAGLEPQQYLLLLTVKGMPEGREATIQSLSEWLVLRHHSVVELTDRMEAHGFVKRTRSTRDRRNVIVSLSPRGEKLLQRVVKQRIGELRARGQALVESISALLESKARTNPKLRTSRKAGR
jgi:DNA-binding MarR family transcriptional regulator